MRVRLASYAGLILYSLLTVVVLVYITPILIDSTADALRPITDTVQRMQISKHYVHEVNVKRTVGEETVKVPAYSPEARSTYNLLLLIRNMTAEILLIGAPVLALVTVALYVWINYR